MSENIKQALALITEVHRSNPDSRLVRAADFLEKEIQTEPLEPQFSSELDLGKLNPTANASQPYFYEEESVFNPRDVDELRRPEGEDSDEEKE